MEDLKIFPWLKDFQDNLIDIKTLYEFSSRETIMLREELQITHNTYKNEIQKINMELDYKDYKINESIRRLLDTSKEIEILKDENVLLRLKNNLLIQSREDWVGRSLKFHYLFQEMDKIGLKQSEYVFDAYKDIEIPLDEIPIYLKERFIPTILTNPSEVITDSSDSETN
tara:strand:- start:2907 stop:3416 length:510 start_codon:yes stop_codon:yes gene_type:complete